MELKKYRWSKAYESAEEELVLLLAAKNIQTVHWIAEADEVFADSMYGLERRLWCAEGSIKIIVAGNKDVSLQPGDALDIPAYTVHGALAGINGAICYEFPTPADNPIIPLEK
jgi:hypothetical protein